MIRRSSGFFVSFRLLQQFKFPSGWKCVAVLTLSPWTWAENYVRIKPSLQAQTSLSLFFEMETAHYFAIIGAIIGLKITFCTIYVCFRVSRSRNLQDRDGIVRHEYPPDRSGPPPPYRQAPTPGPWVSQSKGALPV